MGEEDLLNLFSPLQDYNIETFVYTQELIQSLNSANSSQESMLKEHVTQVGAIISVRWSTSEVGILVEKQDGIRRKFMGIVKRSMY